jgi:hypothetical protein
MIRNRYYALVWLCLSVVPCALSQQGGSLTAFTKSLNSDGFDVRQGSTMVLDLWGLYCGGVIPNAVFNNKGVPYVAVSVPRLTGDVAPPTQPFTYQLGPAEAVVMIGLTPPPVAFFSYQPYVIRKEYPQFIPSELRTPPIAGCQADPAHCLDVSTSLGDSVNVATIHTTGPTPFSRPMVLVLTADQGTDARIRGALRAADYPPSIVNTLVLPASLLKLGIGPFSDQIALVARYAKWADPATGQAYLDSLKSSNSPISVFRVTPRNSPAPNPLPAPKLRIRGTGKTEMDLMGKLGELRQAIIASNPGSNVTEYIMAPRYYDGYDYLQRGARAYGDTRDALYLSAGYHADRNDGINLTLDPDRNEYLIVYGVNHSGTGKATYMNINIYASRTTETLPDGSTRTEDPRLALASIFDTSLAGTAGDYLHQPNPSNDLLYAYKIKWSCDPREAHCLSLSADVADCKRRLVFGKNTQLLIATRSYLEPATKVGPAFTEILYDRVLKFSSPSPSR